MARKPTPKRDDPEESERFIKTAREIGAEENPGKFERAFKKVASKPDIKARPRPRGA